jgi:NADH-quinone oxidoreductase subunit D
LDPEGSVFGELSVCLAVEDLLGVQVPPRAQAIRLALCELTRISSHLAFIVRIAHAVGADTMAQYVLRDRERILDLFELLTGARFSLNFLRFGGVRLDITEGFVERVQDVCETIRARIKEYNDLFTFNHAFLKRTVGVGVISTDFVKKMGVTGPNARAAGIPFDVRKEYPYCGYEALEFEVPMGLGDHGIVGDCHDRFLLRLREISQSVILLKQVCETMTAGPFNARKSDQDLNVPAGEAYSRIESPRGLLSCHLVSEGGETPKLVQFRTPSSESLSILPALLLGLRIEDLPVLLHSLDLSVSEVDK